MSRSNAKLNYKGLRIMILAIAFVINSLPLNAAIQNNLSSVENTTIDKSNSPDGLLIEFGQKVGTDGINGGLILLDRDTGVYRSIVNENGTMMINIDGNGDLKRILTEDDILGGSSDDLGNHTASQDLDLNGFSLINAGAAVINENGDAANDFRVESNGDEYLIFAQAGSDSVGVGTASPSALLDVGNGSIDFIDGDRDVLVGDDLEVDGTIFSDNFNGLTANVTTVNSTTISNTGTITGAQVNATTMEATDVVATTFNGTNFIGGTFNGSFVGDGSQLTGVLAAGDNLGNHIADQDLDMNGFSLTNVAAAVINENGDLGNDFRVESNGDEYLIFAQAASDSVGIGTASPSALLDVGNGSVDFIDGINDVLIGDDLEVDGTVFSDNFNGLAASITTIDATTINATSFNGGTFNGSFVGDGSGLTGLSFNNGTANNLVISNGYLQDPTINGFALFRNGGTAMFNGDVYISKAARNGFVLASDANGLATWQNLTELLPAGAGGDNLGNHIADQDLDMNGFSLTNVAAAVINENGDAANDFRVESNGDEYLIFAQAGSDSVGVGTASPSALLDVGNGSVDFIDGINDVLIGDDLEVDGTVFSNNFNGLAANITSIDATTINATNFNGGVFNGSFVGDGSQLTGIESVFTRNADLISITDNSSFASFVLDGNGTSSLFVVDADTNGGIGIGVADPGTKLDVDGALALRKIAADVVRPPSVVASAVATDTNTVTIAVSVPAHSTGDLLVAAVANRNGGSNNTPAGWTAINNVSPSGALNMATFYRYATGSEPGSYSFTSSSSSDQIQAFIVSITDMAASTPIQNSTTDTPATAGQSPGVITTGFNSLVLRFAGATGLIAGSRFADSGMPTDHSYINRADQTLLDTGLMYEIVPTASDSGVAIHPVENTFAGPAAISIAIAANAGAINESTSVANAVVTWMADSAYPYASEGSYVAKARSGATTRDFTIYDFEKAAIGGDETDGFFNGITLLRGAQNGYILTSDANGLASWQPSDGGADDLGSHTATENLDLANFDIINAGGAVINEAGDASNDFRVESSSEQNLIFAQAASDSVGIGTASPSALLDIGNGSIDFIDGDNDVIIADDLEVDGTIFSDNFNGLAANITSIDATTINATGFNGGTFNGTFLGDGSGLTGVATNNGIINNLTLNNGYLQDPIINGFALFRNGGTAIFNGELFITDGAVNGYVLTTDANGLATWQNLVELLPPSALGDNLGNHLAEQDLDLNGFSLINVGAAVINENGDAANDFRVESNGDEYLIFAQAGSDSVGIGTASPSALLDIGNGSIDFIDGDNDVIIADDLEVDGTAFADNFNGLAANIASVNSTTIINTGTITGATINGTTINATDFIGGTFNGSFVGDGSQLTGVLAAGDNLGNHIAEQDLDMNGFALINATSLSVDSLVVNENGDLGNDFRVESNGDEYLIFAQANTDSVGIGTASPSALLDIGNGSVDFIDGDNDVLIGDDLEVDGTIFSDNFNGLAANITTIDAATINATDFNGGTFNGTFLGDGSGLTNLSLDGGTANDLVLNNGYLQDPTINGFALFRNGGTAMFNGDVFITDGAVNGFVLTTDANGLATWQNLTELIPGGIGSDNLGNHIADQDLDMNGFSLTNVAGAVINENGDAANDFRVESNGDEYLIFAQAGSDSVGIGTASPSALLDVGNGSIDFIDGDDDVLIGDDLEVDGTIFSDNFNGLAANITTIDAATINATDFNGGTFNGTFLGDGSGLTNLSLDGGTANDLVLNNGYLQDPTINGFALFRNGGTAMFNGDVFITDGAVNGFVLTTDANGLVSWQNLDQLVIGITGDNLGDHAASQDFNLNGFSLTNGNVLTASIVNGTTINATDFFGGTFNGTFVGDGSQLTGIVALGDNLGNHIADQDIDANGFNLINVAGAVINENGDAANDLRVESDNDEFLILAQASTDSVGIGTSSPAALLDVGNGSIDFIDGDNDVIIADDLEVDDTVFAANFNGLTANIDVMNSNQVIADQFNGGVFNGTFFGDGSGLRNVAGEWGQTNNMIHPRENSGGKTVLIGGTVITPGGADIVLYANGGAVFNDNSYSNQDFRVESSGSAGALFIDSSTDQVGIMDLSPSATLSVGAGVSAPINIDGTDDIFGTDSLEVINNIYASQIYASSSVNGTNIFGVNVNAQVGNIGAINSNTITNTGLITSAQVNATTMNAATFNGTDFIGGTFNGTFVGDGSGLTGLVALGDDLGNHIAEQTLDMNGFNLFNANLTVTNSLIVNENGDTGNDFRVESNGDEYLIFAQANTDSVGIGTASPSALLDVGNGSVDFIDGQNDVLIGDDLEVDGTAFADNFNGLAANVVTVNSTTINNTGTITTAVLEFGTINGTTINGETINATTFNGTDFIGGTFNGTFVGDGSQLTGVVALGDDLGNHIAEQTLDMNGFNLFNANLTVTNSLIVNENGDTGNDFRVESNGDEYLIFAQANTDSVGIGTASPSALLDVGNGSVDFIDGDNDVLIGDDLEVDGTAFADNFNGLTADITTIDASVVNSALFNGGIFNGTFIGDGSGLTGISAASNGSAGAIQYNDGANGFAAFNGMVIEVVDGNGRMGINTTNPTASLTINGTLAYTTSDSITIDNGGIAASVIETTYLKIETGGSDVTMDTAPQIGAGVVGQMLIIQSTDASNLIEFVDGLGMSLTDGVSFSLSNGDTMNLIFDGTTWIEVNRSDKP